MPSLFQYGAFKSAAGLDLSWKIECDSLTSDDLDCIARISAPAIGLFCAVVGVPEGGLKLAKAFEPYCQPAPSEAEAFVLVVDDVWTTGKSMYALVNNLGLVQWKGFVVFARGPYPPQRIQPFMKVMI